MTSNFSIHDYFINLSADEMNLALEHFYQEYKNLEKDIYTPNDSIKTLLLNIDSFNSYERESKDKLLNSPFFKIFCSIKELISILIEKDIIESVLPQYINKFTNNESDTFYTIKELYLFIQRQNLPFSHIQKVINLVDKDYFIGSPYWVHDIYANVDDDAIFKITKPFIEKYKPFTSPNTDYLYKQLLINANDNKDNEMISLLFEQNTSLFILNFFDLALELKIDNKENYIEYHFFSLYQNLEVNKKTTIFNFFLSTINEILQNKYSIKDARSDDAALFILKLEKLKHYQYLDSVINKKNSSEETIKKNKI